MIAIITKLRGKAGFDEAFFRFVIGFGFGCLVMIGFALLVTLISWIVSSSLWGPMLLVAVGFGIAGVVNK